MANQLHDIVDRLASALTERGSGSETVRPSEAAAPAARGWPVETADLFVVDPSARVAVSTLGDPQLARELASTRYPGLALAAPTATENVGVEKLVRNMLADPAMRVLVVAGPETGGTAPTGHYAGDALVCLYANGVDAETMRIRGARGRRPILKNLTPAIVEVFRRHVRVVDLRGETDRARILASVDEELVDASSIRSDELGASSPTLQTGAVVVEPPPEGPRERSFYHPDPVGYVLVFADHAAREIVMEHYTKEHARTAVLAGSDPEALARAAIQRGLVGTLEHAAYIGRELQRAADALVVGAVYVQD